jgi:hypothetical protein
MNPLAVSYLADKHPETLAVLGGMACLAIGIGLLAFAYDAVQFLLKQFRKEKKDV